jgi:iron complex outermembrane receptor protein
MWRGVVVVLLLPATPELALAQQSEGAAVLETIVVTARRREETLQKVPLAVSVLSGEQLEAASVKGVFELQYLTPNLVIGAQPSAAQATVLSIRGQNQADLLLTTDSSVGVYVDGVNIPRTVGFRANNFDVERVEVLKGPQGTLYGRNTTGGAINIVTRRPDHEGLHGSADVTAGNYDRLDYSAAVNIPIIADSLAIRLAGQRTARDGYGKSRSTGRELADDDEWFGRASLLYEGEKLDVHLTGDWQRVRESGAIIRAASFGASPASPEFALRPPGVATTFLAAGVETGLPLGPGAVLGGWQALQPFLNPDHYASFVDERVSSEYDAWGLGGTITLDLSGIELTSITGYREFERLGLEDIDGTPLGLLHPQQGSSSDFFSQELQLSGLGLDERLTWQVGAYYSNEDGIEGDGSITLALRSINPTVTLTNGDVENESWAVYGQTTYALTPRLNLTTGARWTAETKTLISHNRRTLGIGGPVILCNVPGGTIDNCTAKFRDEFDDWSWLVSLDYALTDDALMYVRTARGFRGGGQNARGGGDILAFQEFDPEYAQDVEVGLKADLFDRRLRLNTAAFWTDYEDIQRTVIIPIPGTLSTIMTNAAEATVWGLEVEAIALLGSSVTLTASLGYLDAEYDKFDDVNPSTGVPIDRSGESFGLPKWNLNVGARHEYFWPQGYVLGTQVNWYWQSEVDGRLTTTDPTFPHSLTERDAFDLLSARVDFEFERLGLTIALSGTNLLDEEYYVAAQDLTAFGLANQVSGEPRTYALTVRKNF